MVDARAWKKFLGYLGHGMPRRDAAVGAGLSSADLRRELRSPERAKEADLAEAAPIRDAVECLVAAGQTPPPDAVEYLRRRGIEVSEAKPRPKRKAKKAKPGKAKPGE